MERGSDKKEEKEEETVLHRKVRQERNGNKEGKTRVYKIKRKGDRIKV